MRAYVVCQMDYSSPVFPEMDGPFPGPIVDF